MSTLVSRKSLYLLGNRGILNILEWIKFYILRLKVLISLPSEKRTELRTILKLRLTTIRASFDPFCGNILCQPRDGGCKTHCSLPTSDVPLTDPKLKSEKHLMFPGVIRGSSLLGEYEIPLVTVKPSPDFFFTDFSYNKSLRIYLFDYLCCLFTAKLTIKGFQLRTLMRPVGTMYLACGRKQRCFITEKTFEPRLRILDPKSSFFRLCISAAHTSSLGKSPQESTAYLLGLNVTTSELKKHVTNFTSTCYACNLNRAYDSRNNHLMQSLEPSPSGRLLSLASAESSFNHVCVDLSGQYSYLTYNRQRQSIYFLMCVSCHWAGETKVIPLRDKTVTSIMTGFQTLAYHFSTKINVCLFDAGTEFLTYVNQVSPMQPLPKDEVLADKWYESLLKKSVQTHLEQSGIFLQFGKARHAAVSVAENKIRLLKRMFKSLSIFRKSDYPCDIFDIHLILSLVHHIVATRPICILGNKIYSLQDFRTLLLRGGNLMDSNCGIPIRGAQVKKAHDNLHDLRNIVINSMLAQYIPSLLKSHHDRENYKQSIPVEELRPGDIVFDSVTFREQGTISGSLARVIQKSQSERFCLVQKCVMSHGKLRQVCLSRPCEKISFICPGTREKLYFDQNYELFNFEKCLQRQKEPTTLYNLPSGPPIGALLPLETDSNESENTNTNVNTNTNTNVNANTNTNVNARFSSRGRRLKTPARFLQ